MIVACYERVSSSEQFEHGYSIGEQKERLAKYADAMGWQVFRHYTDGGFTGANIERPAMRELIADVKARKVQKVIVYKLDRLSRSQKDTLFLIEDVFLPNGCDFISMSESFDTSSSFGKAMIGILSVFAQLEREQIKERMKMGKEGRAKKGLWHGGKFVPAGYRYNAEAQTLTIDEAEAEQVKTIFQMFANGHSFRSIGKAMQGKETQYGPWSDNHIKAVLTNPTYCGQLPFGGEVYSADIPALISAETFQSVQERIKAHDDEWRTGNRAPNKKSPLSGLVYCAHCGAKYSVRHNRRDTHPYMSCYSRSKNQPRMVRDPNCKNRIWRLDELEEAVLSQITEKRFNQDELNRPKETSRPEADRMKKEIERLRRQRSRLIDLYAAGTIPFDEINSKSENISKAISTVESKLAALQDGKKISAEQAALKIEKFADMMKFGTKEQISAIVRELIEKVVIDGETVHIYWKF